MSLVGHELYLLKIGTSLFIPYRPEVGDSLDDLRQGAPEAAQRGHGRMEQNQTRLRACTGLKEKHRNLGYVLASQIPLMFGKEMLHGQKAQHCGGPLHAGR